MVKEQDSRYVDLPMRPLERSTDQYAIDLLEAYNFNVSFDPNAGQYLVDKLWPAILVEGFPHTTIDN